MIGNKANVESKQDEKLLILKKLVLNTILQTAESVVDIFHAGVKNLGYWFQAAMIDHLMNEGPSILH